VNRPLSIIELLESDASIFLERNNSPNKIEDLDDVEVKLRVSFPKDYREFLRDLNGIEFHDCDLVLFGLGNVDDFNPDPDWSIELPGMIFIGTDHGDNIFYADPDGYLGREKWAIYSVGLGARGFDYSIYVTSSFTHLIQRALNREDLTDGPFLKDEGYHPRPD
jgi:SMI1 / KNR4 family (SUKH-1)